MSELGFAVIWVTTLVMMFIFRNKALVFDWERGLKVYLEDIDYEEDNTDEMQ